MVLFIKKVVYGFFISLFTVSWGQSQDTIISSNRFHTFFMPKDDFHKVRFQTALTFTSVTYSAFSTGLYHAWYKNFDKGPFRLYNDWGEWSHMDKWGHVYSSYFQTMLGFNGARWTGLNSNKAIWTGLAMSTLFQTTIEVMDGFSSEWGFSLPDVAANTAGSLLFATQQRLWNQQRILLKFSSSRKEYSDTQIISSDGLKSVSLSERAYDLYGSGIFERYLKDYNAQIYWASIRIHSFLPESAIWPPWLNVALGYSAENMFGGYVNTWTHQGHVFEINPEIYPRYSQFFLGFDIDLPGLNPGNPLLKTLCSVFQIFKIPGPAIELNTRGQIKFHIFR